jgi:hypothetical protein
MIERSLNRPVLEISSSRELTPALTADVVPPAGRGSLFVWLLAVLLAVVTMLLYWPMTRCDFTNYEDADYVTANPQVQGGLTWANVAWAFTTDHASNWHPITWLSLMLDASLFGDKAAGFHFTNVVLHTVNAVLLFWILWGLTAAKWRSALEAAFFAWHPVHVESVAWGRMAESIQQYQYALRLDPGEVTARSNVAKTLAKETNSTVGTASPAKP